MNTPFYLYQRKPSLVYYVALLSDIDGKPVAWRSTGTKDRDEAERIAWNLFRKKSDDVDVMALVRKSTFTTDQAKVIVEQLKKQGLIMSYTLPTAVAVQNAYTFLLNFWNPEASEYLQNRKRLEGNLHKTHIKTNTRYINYFKGIFQQKRLGELTKEDFFLTEQILDDRDMEFNSRNTVLSSLRVPFRWLYNQGLLDDDLSRFIPRYSAKAKKKNILTMELAAALYQHKWQDEACELANKLSMLTGLRGGEISALALEDIGVNKVYVKHSYSYEEGLKSTKTGEERTVLCGSPSLLEQLTIRGQNNPAKSGRRYIFWQKGSNKPYMSYQFRKELHKELQATGLTEAEAEKYTFHGWRHFYTAYMSRIVQNNLLQRQTGHKSLEVFNMYANHETDNDTKTILTAQQQVFGALLK